jgi:hypothetical protein
MSRITMTWHSKLLVLMAAVAAGCTAAGTPSTSSVAPTPAVQVSPAGGPAAAIARAASPESIFGGTFLRLSEPAGYFPSENVVSNETSYLLVLDAMRRIGVKGGAYIGVGPDQNFSYIAAIRPEVAFIFDVRRDDMLEHLMFKAAFAMSRNRLEYLCTILAKPVPADIDAWTNRSLTDIIAYVDRTPASVDLARSSEIEIERRVGAFGIPLDANDLYVVAAYRAAFIRNGLDVQYSSIDNGRRNNMPGWRELLVEVDRSGNQLNYLAADSLFQYIMSMESQNRIIPVTGNVAGTKALRALGDEIRSRGLVISAFYMSNVEQYLMQDGSFPLFAANVKTLPMDDHTVFIRSLFGNRRTQSYHPMSVAGYNSTQLLQYMKTFVAEFDAGQLLTYDDLLYYGYITP